MILLRRILWHLDTSRRARKARQAYVAAGLTELDHYLKEQAR